jgi:hypothetical protein
MLRLFFFLFIGGLSANAASVLACTPEIPDVQVLPPLEPNTAHDRHTLAIELQHRSQSGCQLLAPLCSCCPRAVPTPSLIVFLVTRSYRKTVPTLDPSALRGKFKITVEQN